MRRTIGPDRALSAAALGAALLLGTSAPAQNTTTTTSTETHKTITPQLATFRYDEYETRVTARMGAGPSVFDQTFPLPFSDPAVQAAISAASAALRGAGAVAIQGPNLISSQTTFVGTTATFQDTIVRSTQTVFTTTLTGPLCIGVGNRDVGPSVPCPPLSCGAAPSANPTPCFGTPFPIASGNVNVDTTTHTELFVNRMITEIDTYQTDAHYDLVGQQALVDVPALSAGGLAALGGLLVAAALIALRPRA